MMPVAGGITLDHVVVGPYVSFRKKAAARLREVAEAARVPTRERL